MSVTFNNVSIFKIAWKISDLDLIINKSNLETSTFSLDSDLNRNNRSINKATISNSTFGNLKSMNLLNITMSKCNMIGGAWKDTLIEVINSNLHILDCVFSKHNTEGGAAVLKAERSKIVIQKVSFNQNVGQLGVIHVTHGSTLQINESTFYFNGFWDFFYAKSTIILQSGSIARMVQCQFVQNIASTGGCVFSYPNTLLTIANSIFTNNFAQNGAAIYCQGSFQIEGTTDPIMETRAGIHENRNTMLLSDLQTAQCVITNSTFYTNTAIQYGGSFFIDKSSAEVNNCTFNSSVAFLSGGTFMMVESTLQINGTNFDSGLAVLDGGIIWAFNKSSISITNSIINGCMGIKGSCIFMENYVNLRIFKTTIQDKYNPLAVDILKAYSLYFANHCSVTIYQSHFLMDYIVPYIFYLENDSNLTILSTSFNKTATHGASMLMATGTVRVTFKHCVLLAPGGFSLSNNSILVFENSHIDDCRDTKDKYLISVVSRSHIIFLKSNITNINPDLKIVFVQTDSLSNLTMSESTYKNNNLSSHFEISGSGHIFIDRCNFINNTFRFTFFYATIFTITDSKLHVKGSIFHNNYLRHHVELHMIVTFRTFASDVNITETIFSHSSRKYPPHYALQMQPSGLSEVPSNFLQIDRCVFDTKGGSLRIEDVANINIQSSFFQMALKNSFFASVRSSGLELSEMRNVRIANSTLNASLKSTTLLTFMMGSKEFLFMTENSTLTARNKSVHSSEHDFLIKAKNLGLVKGAVDTHLETPFASSKLHVINFLHLMLICTHLYFIYIFSKYLK